MRRAALLTLALALPPVTPQLTRAPPHGVGSCYEVRPICMPPQNPLCICDLTYNCMWVCK